MFIVRRPFKNLGKVYTAGSVISEPAIIKRFKGKLAEGKIIEVTEQTYDVASKYFKSKYGVDIPPLSDTVETEEEVETEEVETEEVETEEVETEPVKIKATAKAKATAVTK